MCEAETRIARALSFADKYGDISGVDYKQWVIDQILRELLTGDEYKSWVADYDSRREGYHWDTGMSP